MREELHEWLLLALLGEASFETLGQLCDPDVFPDEYSLILLFVLGGRQDPEYFKDEPKRGQDLELLSFSWFSNSLAQWVWQSAPVFLPGESPWSLKNLMQNRTKY